MQVLRQHSKQVYSHVKAAVPNELLGIAGLSLIIFKFSLVIL